MAERVEGYGHELRHALQRYRSEGTTPPPSLLQRYNKYVYPHYAFDENGTLTLAETTLRVFQQAGLYMTNAPRTYPNPPLMDYCEEPLDYPHSSKTHAPQAARLEHLFQLDEGKRRVLVQRQAREAKRNTRVTRKATSTASRPASRPAKPRPEPSPPWSPPAQTAPSQFASSPTVASLDWLNHPYPPDHTSPDPLPAR